MGNKNRLKVLGVAGVLTFAIGLSGCGLMPEEEEALAPPLAQPKRQQYDLYKTEKKSIVKRSNGTGELVSSKPISLHFKESGKRIKSIDIKYGQQVKKGDVLIRMDVGNMESRIKLQEYGVNKAQVQLEQIEKQEDVSRLDVRNLQDSISTLQQQYKKSNQSNSELKDRIKAQEYSLSKAQIVLEQVIKQKESARLDVLSAKIMLEDLKAEYLQSVLVAPMDGQVVFLENLKEGDMVEAFKEIIRIADTGEVQVFFKPDSDVDEIKTGMKAEIKYNGTAYEGEVVLSPDNVPNDASEAYKNAVIIKVKSLPEGAKLGEAVSVSIPVKSKDNAVVIPRKALKELPDKKYVQVMEGTSKRELDVEVGIVTPLEAEIVAGLNEGQMVILN
ncbi:MAG: HlyD family efflux transporter periplasmic adaptor subunit [Clostridia bacterium]|nr:HlyD family efflux transporter periplasmic adaptor subunit [Clostridia bacterium]